MPDKVIYEQPLNERTRNLLRLEHLFSQVSVHLQIPTDWHCRFVLVAMLEIVDLLSRSDFKAELIKELEKHFAMLNALKDNSAVDLERLNVITSRITKLLTTLRDNSFQPGNQLKQDELVTSFKQRATIPGGTCNFDLPRFHHWLNLPESKRKADLVKWFSDLEPIKQASFLTMDMIRNSSSPLQETARDGFYQQPLETAVSCQLIRVVLTGTSPYYPEISGGKHRFTIHFMESGSTVSRAMQTDNDVQFELYCCIL